MLRFFIKLLHKYFTDFTGKNRVFLKKLSSDFLSISLFLILAIGFIFFSLQFLLFSYFYKLSLFVVFKQSSVFILFFLFVYTILYCGDFFD